MGAVEANDLNRDCHCISIDTEELSRQFARASQASGLDTQSVVASKSLFANVPVYIAKAHVTRMQDVVRAIEHVTELPGYRELAFNEAPAIARHDPKARGVFFGYDFHLSDAGPKLIEINTNAGGALLNILLARAQRACCADVQTLAVGPVELSRLDDTFAEMFVREYALAKPGQTLTSIAIVDSDPTQQFLYDEFVLFRALFERHGLRAVIAAPEELTFADGKLWHKDLAIDLVYNRSTDFYLAQGTHTALHQAYLANAAVITPHPRAHALFANKQHLVTLADTEVLRSLGADPRAIELLAAHVPRARRVLAEDADTLWQERKRLFFKPLTGYGSKAAYRGDKLTKGTFAEILTRDYIAQELVPPSERFIEVNGARVPLKLDVRNYVYDGHVQLLAARLYHGQTTNFRTEGGGFAPVYTDLQAQLETVA